MNRYRVEELIGDARAVIDEQYKGQDTIDKMMRSKMSAFGAAVIMSGVLPAIAFYRENEPVIVTMLEKLYKKVHKNVSGEIFAIMEKEIREQRDSEATEELLAMSVSLKMAFNLFKLVQKKPGGGRDNAGI